MASIQPIVFMYKNAADWTNASVVLSATEAPTYVANLQKRSNNIGWMTTGSVDANNTTITCNFNDLVTLTDIVLVNHNFKSFTVKYWDGSAWVDFSTPINETANVDSSSGFNFASVNCTQIQIIITGTQVANTDKRMTQLVASSRIGQLNGWPIIKHPTFNLNKRVNTMLSGKQNINRNLGGFSCTLEVANWSNAADLSVVEQIYGAGYPFLVWLCGGSEAQFSSVRQAYRKQDIFLMQCVNEFTPEWVDGLYKTGMRLQIDLVEVV